MKKPFPWKCGACGNRSMEPSEEPYSTEIFHDGRSYTVSIPLLRILRCSECQAVVLDDEANGRISDAFRTQAGLLRPEEIRDAREKLRMTQEELANTLGFAKETLSRWENGGQIQKRSLDKLLRIFFRFPEIRSALTASTRTPFKNLPPESYRRARKFQLTAAVRIQSHVDEGEPAPTDQAGQTAEPILTAD